MARSVVYCTDADVTFHFAKVRLPPEIDMSDAISLGSDEMDGYLGYRYVIPIPVNPSDPSKNYGTQLLKTICSQLVAGRIMVSVAAGGEKSKTHDYGKYLIENAQEFLCKIKDGKLNISFAVENTDEGSRAQGPIMAAGDAFSMVDQYYENIEPNGFLGTCRTVPGSVPWPRR